MRTNGEGLSGCQYPGWALRSKRCPCPLAPSFLVDQPVCLVAEAFEDPGLGGIDGWDGHIQLGGDCRRFLALEGEAVVITLNDGRPAVELKPVSLLRHKVTPAELDWLAQHRIGRLSGANDAGSLVSRMRDEDER